MSSTPRPGLAPAERLDPHVAHDAHDPDAPEFDAGGPNRPLRVLFVSPYVPSQIRIRPYHWIKHLAASGHSVSLHAIGGRGDEAAVEEMRRLCAHVSVFPLPPWRPIVNGLRALVDRDPFQRAWSRLPAMSAALRRAVSSGAFDVAHVEHLRGSCFADDLRPLPVVYDAVDSISLLFEQTARLAPALHQRLLARLDVGRTSRFEATVLDRFRVVLLSSPVDAIRFRELAGRADAADGRLAVVSNPVDLRHFTPPNDTLPAAESSSAGRPAIVMPAAESSTVLPAAPPSVVFFGKMSYHANAAAALALVRDVMPRVWRQRPDVRVQIVGQHPGRDVRALASDARVTVTGFVPDVQPWIAGATLAVFPMRYGVGVQNKVLEALAAGVPVVVARSATAGLRAVPGRDLVAAEGSDECADAVLRLLGAPAERSALARRGREYVERFHDPRMIGRELEAIYRRAVADRPV
ncbi:MAG: glycosyltransferase family 4 protein [Vicinamibacterales bacterium]